MSPRRASPSSPSRARQPRFLADFSPILEREARARDIRVVDAASARYLARGYLSAAPTEDGASIEYVWDVFTADKRRAQRLSAEIDVKGSGADPWALAGEAALKGVAAASADDLAAFLSDTPEAVASRAGAGRRDAVELRAPIGCLRQAHSVDRRGAPKLASSQRRIVPGRRGCYDPPVSAPAPSESGGGGDSRLGAAACRDK